MTRALYGLLLVSLGLALSALAWAGTPCPPRWTIEYAGQVFESSSASGAAGAAISYHNAHTETTGITYEVWTLTSCDSGGGCGYNITVNAGAAGPHVCEDTPGACSTYAGGGMTATSHIPDSCDSTACGDKAGQEQLVGNSVALGNACLNGCQVSSGLASTSVKCTAAGSCSSSPGLRMAQYSGASCNVETDPEAKAADCVSGSFGRVCASKSDGKNCGTFNGAKVCVESFDSGCRSLSGGGMACVVEGPGATTEVPDNGTPGEPAQPDMQVSKDGKTVNYYSSGTVQNSSVNITTGDGSGGDDGSGSGDDGEPFQLCEGVDACVGGLGTVSGFQASTSAFMARVEGSPLLGAVSNIGASIPEADCEAPSFEAFGQTLSLDGMCQVANSVLPLLGVCMLFAWGVLAARVLLSA